MLRSFLDEVGRNRITGWAQDEAQPDAPLSLLILVNEALVARVLANRHRPDLAAAGIKANVRGITVDARLRTTNRRAFAIGDHCHLGGVGQHACRGLTARQPTRRFLVFNRTAAPGRDAIRRPCPNRRINKTDHRFTFDIDGNHRMDEEARRLAIAGGTSATF